MKIYRSLEEVPADFGPSALTIGNFDGVHTGHRSILRRVTQVAAARGWKPSALMFDPHPARVVAPQRAPRLMTSPARRAALMAAEGIEQVLILPFTTEVARLTPEQFARQIVAGRLGARAVLVGDNFRFGHDHAGNVETLRALGSEFGFETEIVPAVARRGRAVSSSAIRGLIESGRVALAARWLERPYSLEGDVVAGRGIGSRQTVPTLNLSTAAELIPKTGVYVTRTRDLDTARAWNSITNVGYRPTFGDSTQLTIETFLLDPPAGETPRRISVEFLWRVREERKFSNPEALKARILRDAAAARRYFARTRRLRPLAPAQE
ncbi:MAG: bifunctional riboflavin kinase/FAD synthetase [Bryobacteraceae bacterium]|jgi:riboflavin kinase/FMN adenylyltransferase